LPKAALNATAKAAPKASWDVAGLAGLWAMPALPYGMGCNGTRAIANAIVCAGAGAGEAVGSACDNSEKLPAKEPVSSGGGACGGSGGA
jgi:hypothetical protein